MIRSHAIGLTLSILLISTATANRPAEFETDVCVVGGGSGGFGAALSAARAGVDVILVEQQPQLGGTSTQGFVSNWEPGPGSPVDRELFERLAKHQAVGITRDHNADRRLGPFGLWLMTSEATFDQTLRRTGRTRPQWRAVVYDPDVMASVMATMLDETGRCRVMLKTRFVQAESKPGHVEAIRVRAPDGWTSRITARLFVDSTGDGLLCRLAGHKSMLGPESKRRFNEPSAPDEPGKVLNAISLCYRIRKSENPVRQAAPEVSVKRWPHSAHVSSVPGGDLIVNPLAMLPGTALLDLGYERAMARCRHIVKAHWRWLQAYPTFSGYEFVDVAPKLGVRESYRIECEYILTQHDLLAGLTNQKHPDIIAVADHSMDVHGTGGRRIHGDLKEPYGIPYRCMIPKGATNLLVACRGAGFSQIAASSCRLNRTMTAIGHAAGNAAALAVKHDVSVGQVDMDILRQRVGMTIDRRKSSDMRATNGISAHVERTVEPRAH